jgi:hypothetical protein
MAAICVYEHWRPDTDEPFYVGCGSGRRANELHRHRTVYHMAVQEALSRLGYCVEGRLVRAGLTQEEGWALEVERIAFWRAAGVDLVNQTVGGPGNTGRILPPASHARMSASQTGRRHPAETRAKMVASWTPERRAAVTERNKKTWTPERRAEQAERLRAAWTPERRAAQAERIRALAKASVEDAD